MHLAKFFLYWPEAIMRIDDEFIDLAQFLLNFSFLFVRELGVLQKWSPELTPRIEVVRCVTKSGQIEVGNFLLDSRECLRSHTS